MVEHRPLWTVLTHAVLLAGLAALLLALAVWPGRRHNGHALSPTP